MKAARGVLLVALAVLALGALRDCARLGDELPWHQLYDFTDFYCAGSALDGAADPYHYEPLHRCEHRVSRDPAYAADPHRTVPAPLPPYDFPPFMLVARLDFPTARTVDAVAIVVAIAISIAGLALAGVALDVAALALLLPAGFVLLRAGQVVPFALAALIFCGAALARGRPRLAGMLAALTLIEPHLGLPVCAAMLAWVPRSRLGLLAAALALAGIGALMVGVSGLVEYVARVLPAQAAAETGYAYQYSLTYALRIAGVPASAALAIGEASYAVMLLLGVWLGGRSAHALRRPQLIAYIPAACSVIAGPYVHMVDLPFAIPAAAVLACTLRGNLKAVAAVALCVLAVPWIPVWITKKLFLIALLVIVVLLARLRPGTAISVAAFVAIAASIYLFELSPPAPFQAVTAGSFAGTDLAQRAWAAYVAALGIPSLTWLAVKVPTWAALVAVLVAAGSAARATAQS